MIFRMASVALLMLRRLLEYVAWRMLRVPGLDGKLERDYRDWAAHILKVFRVDVHVEGREHVPAGSDRRLVIMSNHQSQLDIPVLLDSLGRRLGFVAKQELGRIPLLAYWMRQVGCVFIDRSDRRGAHRALEKAALEMGRHPLVVFPEGTRSKDGRIQPFKLGGFRLAVLAQARILPVLIENTRMAGENRRPGDKGRVAVKVRIFPCFDTMGLGEEKASLLKMKAYVEACFGRAAVVGHPAASEAG